MNDKCKLTVHDCSLYPLGTIKIIHRQTILIGGGNLIASPFAYIERALNTRIVPMVLVFSTHAIMGENVAYGGNVWRSSLLYINA